MRLGLDRTRVDHRGRGGRSIERLDCAIGGSRRVESAILDLADEPLKTAHGFAATTLVVLADLCPSRLGRWCGERDAAEQLRLGEVPGPDSLDHGKRRLTPQLESGVSRIGVAQLSQTFDLVFEQAFGPFLE